MARKKREEAPPPGSPPWMATFSDMITQVLAFFIMLFSFSSIDVAKFKQAIASFQGAFGVMPAGTGVMPHMTSPDGSVGPVKDSRQSGSGKEASVSSIQRELANALKEQKADQFVQVVPGSRRLVLHFDAALLFDSGRAEIKQQAIPALDAIGKVLTGYNNPILIEGHTDSDPMRPGNIQFPDNWMLSAGRAASVLRYFRDFHGLTEEQMSMVGYADIRPVALNDTPEGKAKNRRVDIVILER